MSYRSASESCEGMLMEMKQREDAEKKEDKQNTALLERSDWPDVF